MNVFIAKKIKGMTLIELMISIALFAAMAVVAGYTIMSGIRAQSFDRRVRNAQTAARDVLTKLCNEMRCAAPAPVSGFGETSMPSGVLFPDSYGDSYAKNTGKSSTYASFYALGDKKIGGTSENNLVYYSKNRVIFVRPKTAITSLDSNAVAGQTFNPGSTSDYVYVEWSVPYTDQNKVYRKVYKFSENGGHKCYSNSGTSYWLAITSYFTTAHLISSAAVSSGSNEKFLVGSLDGEYDTFDLCIYHARYIYPGTNSPGIEMPYKTNFDRNLFTAVINTRVMKGKEKATRDATGRWTSSNKDYSEASLTQQVRIQSGI